MILHPHYRTTLTQIDALSFAIDQMRTYAPESRRQTQAIKRLEDRLAILRARRDRNRAQRRKLNRCQCRSQFERTGQHAADCPLFAAATAIQWAEVANPWQSP